MMFPIVAICMGFLSRSEDVHLDKGDIIGNTNNAGRAGHKEPELKLGTDESMMIKCWYSYILIRVSQCEINEKRNIK